MLVSCGSICHFYPYPARSAVGLGLGCNRWSGTLMDLLCIRPYSTWITINSISFYTNPEIVLYKSFYTSRHDCAVDPIRMGELGRGDGARAVD